ncbi:putative TIM-barrel fold metal-dependent hydrolase [Bernardetia litoralis DSM 6794]|uniref:Putative TIM-barrel fold metal-dependent hydrolase n=1 Tax=Bernardetia litoralis (strain ATCC 23117 / DSM 6794 / NBRC 15988 / NCIMB 1366 / Fx l1 / Sio-4) TaxID=880071 RepID=I4AH31_BERLS|nr:amidohydrolase [Bernardetia litoralis]AFM03266.1 putative TIM-barrel fold metal-dependent hydrolase [Bernardetia litoralis DSM 6794]
MSSTLSSCSSKETVDLIVHNAKVYTVDSDFSEQEAFAIRDGKFIETGKSKDILKKYTSARILDAQKKYILPGLIDAHAHLYWLGQKLEEADVSKAKSFDEVITILQKYREANPNKKWIKGYGWNQNNWNPAILPTKELLDEAFPDVPVFIKRIDEHVALVNQKALSETHINQYSKMPKGGSLGFYEKEGEEGKINKEKGLKGINGLLYETAINLATNKMPSLTDEELKRAFQGAEKACFKNGVTSVSDALMDKKMFLFLDSMHREESLKLRIYAMIDPTEENQDYFLKKGIIKTDRLHAGALKLFADGTLGSYGAAMLESYSDSASAYGAMWRSTDEYRELIKKFADKGFQVNTHCIGDSANRIFLDLYGEFLGTEENKNKDLRWRIEHAQVIHPNDLEKFKKFKIIPSVQPTHAISDMPWVETRLGKNRIQTAYIYKKLYEQNNIIAFGTDFPIESVNPFATFHAAVARKDGLGNPSEGFQMENAVSREVALKAMTIWAAHAAFEENEKGSIEAGKFADFILIDTDIMKIDDKLLRNTLVLQTYVNGEMVYISN